MDLHKIQSQLIADRTADAWFRINIAGPYFKYRWDYGTSGGKPFSHVAGEHSQHAVCREEPSLTMSWGMDVHSWEERRDYVYDWARVFPDTSVRQIWVDFFWNNALIDRVQLCYVDGSRGVLPLPGLGLEVTDYELAVAFLVHDLEGGSNSENPGALLDRIGGTRVRDSERWGAGSA